MEAKFKLTIPKPCHEDWNKMTPDITGRFCGSCVKSVVDFTNRNASEIQDYFTKNKGKSVCGRFKNEQLESIIIKVPSHMLHSKMSFHKMFLLALLLSMGTTLLSCMDKNGNQQKIDGVEVVEGNNSNVTTGEPMFHDDSPTEIQSIQPKKDQILTVKNLPPKVKCQNAKSEYSPKEITTMGLVLSPKEQDSIPIEKK